MKQYLDLLQHIKDNGVTKDDRTGTGTKSVFGYQMRFNLEEGFPVITTKKLHLRSIIHELLWFLNGDTNIKYLNDNNVTIWDEWADADGDLGPVYGHQWRKWAVPIQDEKDGPIHLETFDQIGWVIQRLLNAPDCRRIIVSAWNVADLPKMALHPCHCLFQFWTRVREDGKRGLSCQLYQRSCDTFLGVPFNIASYALLTMMIAQVVGMVAEEFVWVGGDTHLYLNHLDQVDIQLSRTPFPLPKMKINPGVKCIFDFQYDDFELVDYQYHPAIKAAISV